MSEVFRVLIPTLNGGDLFQQCINSLLEQDCWPFDVLIIDSGSTDDTVDFAKSKGLNVHGIHKSEFNHGGTRNLGESMLQESKYLIYLTQDAILDNSNSISSIVEYCEEHALAAAYGRQLPHYDASLIAQHARNFNYSVNSLVNKKEDIPERGIKTAFCSNSFSIYNRELFKINNGFPDDVIFGEDMCLAAKLIIEGHKVGYAADAIARHSHNYSFIEEFRRYFDVGVLHFRQSDLLGMFNNSSSEGKRFVISEVKFLLAERKFLLVVNALFRTFLKLLAYKLGRFERFIGKSLKKFLSMNKHYWN